MAATKETLEQPNHRQESNERSCILVWLSAVDYTLQQSDLLSRRQAGTGQWLLASNEHEHWLDTPEPPCFVQECQVRERPSVLPSLSMI